MVPASVAFKRTETFRSEVKWARWTTFAMGLHAVLPVLVALLLLQFGHCFSTTCPDEELSLTDYVSFFEDLLEEKILPFWANRVDADNGGYEVDPENDVRTAISQARLVWGLSHAHLQGYSVADGSLLDAAKHGYDYMTDKLWDPALGTYHFAVDLEGNPANGAYFTPQPSLAQLYVILGFVEYYRASGDADALDKALDLFETIHSADYDFNIYMNTILHSVEALAALYEELDDPEAGKKLEEVLTVDSLPYFPDSLTSQDHFGHMLEFAYFKVEAEKVLGWSLNVTFFVEYMDYIVSKGVHEPTGGVQIEGLLEWWPQTEFVSAVSVAKDNGISGPYEDALLKVLRFLQCNFIDSETGEIVWGVDENGEVSDPTTMSNWKVGYHVIRALIKFINAFG